MKPENKRILFIYTSFTSFVAQDFEILKKNNCVDKFQFELSKKLHKWVWQYLRQFFFLLFRGYKYDMLFIWFADYHSLLPVLYSKITGKKSLVVIGGYDASRLKPLNYGAFTSKFRGFFVIQTIKNCTLNLAVSKYIFRKLGYIAPKAPRKLIYNGVAFDTPPTNQPKEKLVLTVANIQSERTFYLKGMDTFFEVARQLPDEQFMLIGIDKQRLSHLIAAAPPNLKILDTLPHQQLIEYYRRSMVYCQLSRMESFCLALAEAMYFDCYPLITSAGGMPEVTGSYGKVVTRDAALIAAQIRELLAKEQNYFFREHIQKYFSIEKRSSELNRTISDIFINKARIVNHNI